MDPENPRHALSGENKHVLSGENKHVLSGENKTCTKQLSAELKAENEFVLGLLQRAPALFGQLSTDLGLLGLGPGKLLVRADLASVNPISRQRC